MAIWWLCGLKVGALPWIIPFQTQEHTMAKGQQKTNKEVKKTKKDTSPPKVQTGEPVRATITTTVIPRGKDKDKYK
jgi:hypothetical protein